MNEANAKNQAASCRVVTVFLFPVAACWTLRVFVLPAKCEYMNVCLHQKEW